jgi:hypothetical protein
MKIKDLNIVLIVFSYFFAGIFFVSAEEVPFEVVRTKMTADATVPLNGSEVVVIDGSVYDSAAFDPSGNSGLPEKPIEGVDTRVKVPLTGIHYTLDFWNVGQMGGEKGFIFKTSYGNAKLTVEYEAGQAYKMVPNGEKFGDVEIYEKRNVSTPSIDKLEYNLTFEGGPYGRFFLNEKGKDRYLVGGVIDGYKVALKNFKTGKHLVYPEKAMLDIEGDGFDKWMEILEAHPGCQDPSDSKTDSGYRFNDYSGEIYIYPCDDEDAEMYPELDMVLHKNDLIITKDDSYVDIAIPGDMTNFHMGPNSKVVLSYTKEDSDAVRNIKLISGKIYRNVKHMLNGETLEDYMWNGVAGVKGTKYVLEEIGNGSTLKVIDGSVEFTDISTGEKEMVNSGEMLVATKNGLTEKEKFDVENENKIWEELKNGDFNSYNGYVKNNTQNQNTDNERHFILLFSVIALFVLSVAVIVFLRRKKSSVENESDEKDTETDVDNLSEE